MSFLPQAFQRSKEVMIIKSEEEIKKVYMK